MLEKPLQCKSKVLQRRTKLDEHHSLQEHRGLLALTQAPFVDKTRSAESCLQDLIKDSYTQVHQTLRAAACARILPNFILTIVSAKSILWLKEITVQFCNSAKLNLAEWHKQCPRWINGGSAEEELGYTLGISVQGSMLFC